LVDGDYGSSSRSGPTRSWIRTPPDAGRGAGWSYQYSGPAGRHLLTARASDADGHGEPTAPPWNRGGFANNLVQLVPAACLEGEAVKETEIVDAWRLPPRRATVITSTRRVTMRHDAWVVGDEDVVIDWFGASEYVQ
jgi:hypothetical protein